MNFFSDFPGRILGCTYTICLHSQILIFCTVARRSHPPSRVYSYTLCALICCIHSLYDWSFHLYHHIIYICYFVVSYLFLPWYSWFLWRCSVLLLEEIKFLFLSHVQIFSCEISLVCRLNFHRVVFSPFLLTIYFLSIGFRVVSIVSGGCNQSSYALFYVIFESLHQSYLLMLATSFRHFCYTNSIST